MCFIKKDPVVPMKYTALCRLGTSGRPVFACAFSIKNWLALVREVSFLYFLKLFIVCARMRNTE